jgi:hypothetical protein
MIEASFEREQAADDLQDPIDARGEEERGKANGEGSDDDQPKLD